MSAERPDDAALPALPPDWPKPLALLTLLLRAGAPGAGPSDSAARLASGFGPQDWKMAADLAIARHRVAPLIATGLQALGPPEDVAAAIDGHVRANALKTLSHIAETRRIVAALAAAGAEPVVFKGWPLAEQLYGEASARHTGDLDLLLPRDRVHAGYAALAGLGYQARPSEARRMAQARWADGCSKDVELLNRRTGILVELHWHSSKYAGWPEILAGAGALVRHESQAGPVLVPDTRANLFYLSQHGALHLWDRLKWLADIADLVRGRSPADLVRDIAAARAAGVSRPVIFALSLSSRLLASPAPAVLAEAGGCDGAAEPWLPGLERWIIGRLATPYPSWARLRYRVGTRLMGLRLADDWHQTMSVVAYDTTRRFWSLSPPWPGRAVPGRPV